MSDQTDSWFTRSSPPPGWDPAKADPNRYVDPAVQQVQYLPPHGAAFPGPPHAPSAPLDAPSDPFARRPSAPPDPFDAPRERYDGPSHPFDAQPDRYDGAPSHPFAARRDPFAGPPHAPFDPFARRPEQAVQGDEIDETAQAARIDETRQAGQADGTARPAEPVAAKAAYLIPVTPESGWSAAPSRRRRWIGRFLLYGVLLMQALLSLRLSNTAGPDEAVNLVVGRQEFDHLTNGTAVTTDLVGRVAGSARLYPVLAGAADRFAGLTGARLLSLLFALTATALLYSLTRRMFNERVAACAAATYAVLQSTVVVGFYATPDALALMLVALAAWIVVRSDRMPAAVVLAAAPPAALAAAVEHASIVVLPTLLLLAVHTAWPYRGPAKGILRGVLLGAGTGVLLLAVDLVTRVSHGTLARGQGGEDALAILGTAARWSGLFVLLACGGAVAWVRRERMNEAVDMDSVPGSPLRRAALGLTLCATAVLVPLIQAELHTSAEMFRHVGFGLLLASPMAGLGVTRLIGAHFRHPQLGILVWVLMLALGISQSAQRFGTWPGSGPLVGVLRPHVTARGHYLTGVDGIPQYYLRPVTSPGQWTAASTGSAGDVTKGRYGLIVLDTPSSGAEDAVDRAVTGAIRTGGHYRLIAQLPYRASGTAGTYRVYVRQ